MHRKEHGLSQNGYDNLALIGHSSATTNQAWAQLRHKIGGAKNNSAPFDLNLAILEVFSYKASPQKGPISILFYPFLLLTDPIKILIFLQQIAMICSNLPFYSLNMPP